MKKKILVTLIAIVAAFVGLGVLIGIIAIPYSISSYNGLLKSQANVEESWSNVEVYMQRRADLIPNLVNTVKGYTDYEQGTLTAVTEARNAFAKANSVNEQVEASNQLESALDIWVNAVTESYPELKANEQFTALTDELSGSENRIATARKDYNSSAKEYNVEIKKFPKVIIANLFGFESFEYFEAQAGAEKAPQVNFD